MTKNIRIDDDVYSALKSRCNAEGLSMSEAMRAAMRASSNVSLPSEKLNTLESKIDDLKKLFFQTAGSPSLRAKKKRPSRDLNPSRSLDRAP